jgi:hypothetical protein
MKSFQARTHISARSLSSKVPNLRPANPGSVRERDAGEDAVGQEVLLALVRVVTARDHVVEPGRLGAPLLPGLAGDRVQAHGHLHAALPHPHLTAVGLDDVRHPVLVGGGYPVHPDTRRFHDVIVDAE